jgi:hypothetical protein
MENIKKCIPYILLVAGLLASGCKKNYNVDSGVMIFSHTGNINYMPITLYISTKKIDIKLSDNEFAQLRRILRKPDLLKTHENEWRYMDFFNNIVVTDKRTFSKIYQFVTDHDEYWTNNEHRNDIGAESVQININDTKFLIYYPLRKEFLVSLKAYLTENECDKKVVEAISNL